MSQLKQPRFVFLHIPKTGGMTLRHVIYKQFQGVKSLTIKKALETPKFLDRSIEERNKLGLISGHLRFSDEFTFPDATNYFTMLRDPKKRTLSHYNYLNFRTRHPFYNEMTSNNYSIHDMLTKGYVLNFDNCMVRFLSGNVFKDFGTVNQEDYEKAIANFDKYFHHFGINEYFNESILILSYELNWKFPYYANINTTDKKKITSIEGEETLAALAKCTYYDQQLYDYALRKFKAKLERYKPQLEKDLVKLKKGNKLFNFFLKLHYVLNRKKING